MTAVRRILTCAHCEHIRREQRAAIETIGDDRYAGLFVTNDNSDPMTQRVIVGWSTPPNKPPMATCRCDCHGPARIAGLLPRLAAS